MTTDQRQQYLNQGHRHLILDSNKQRYNLDKDGRYKPPNTPTYVLDLEEMKIYEISKSVIKK